MEKFTDKLIVIIASLTFVGIIVMYGVGASQY